MTGPVFAHLRRLLCGNRHYVHQSLGGRPYAVDNAFTTIIPAWYNRLGVCVLGHLGCEKSPARFDGARACSGVLGAEFVLG